jgi:hypothetical protein
MDFKNWFGGDKWAGLHSKGDEEVIADKWWDNLPRSENIQPNIAEINNWALLHATNELVLKSIERDIRSSQVIYHEPISDNLINASSSQLRRAIGTVTTEPVGQFGFIQNGEHAGNLVMTHGPVIFEKYDMDMFASIIYHEVWHAIDWINPAFAKVPPSGKYRFNWKLYTSNLREARSFSAQIRHLLRRLKSIDTVEEALANSQFGLKGKILDVAKIYLLKYGLKMEYASVEIQEVAMARQIVFLLGQMLEKMQFHLFVQREL